MLRRPAMASQRNEKGLQFLNWGVICVSLSVLLTFLVSFVIRSFAVSGQQGLQSLAAVVLPPLSITYVVVFTDLFKNRNARIPRFSLYFLSTLWMLILLILTQETIEVPASLSLPIIELLFSMTLASLIWIYQGISMRALQACCYGILSGLLMYVIGF